MDFIAAHAVEIAVGFVGAIVGEAMSAAVQNKRHGKDPVPCAKDGAFGGFAAGVSAMVFIIIQGALK